MVGMHAVHSEYWQSHLDFGTSPPCCAEKRFVQKNIFGKQECFNVTMPRPLQVFCRQGHSCLGSYLDASAAAGQEICRRLREGKGQFEKLPKVWRHSTLRIQLKIRIFQGCVVSKLLHCPHTMWLNKADVRNN